MIEIPDGVDSQWVIATMERAGITLMAIPDRGPSTKLKMQSLEVMAGADEAAAERNTEIRFTPRPVDVETMLAVFPDWLHFIPPMQPKIRRIVGMRALVSPWSGERARYIWSWRRIADELGSDQRQIRRWHDAGIARIVLGLSRTRARGP